MEIFGKYSPERRVQVEGFPGESEMSITLWYDGRVDGSITVDSYGFFEGLNNVAPDGVSLKVFRPIELPTAAGSVIRIRRHHLASVVLELRDDGLWRGPSGFRSEGDMREEIQAGGSLTVLFDAATEG